ncbi:uncharacterized protein LOC136087619 [Hydra vulgaris]|uniref:Uncharacterized protein LOC136087619 n=1 Tax=Hydra vulgaris TaxID=6087 RepID=A0ABM4CYH1_HYDVU
MSIHKNHPEVIALKTLSKVDRIKKLQDFKKQGILEVNIKESSKENPAYEREKHALINLQITHCSKCLKFVSKRYWHNHSNSCQKDCSIKVLLIPVNVLGLPRDALISESFKKDILSHFRIDRISDICMKDTMILKIGSMMFEKEKSNKDKIRVARNSVRNSMRQLAYLYDIFCQQDNVVMLHKNLSDMFLRQNFMSFKESVEIYTTKDSVNIKAGLKQNLLFLIVKALKIIKGIYYTECKDKDATQIDEFNSVFNMWKDCIFRDASISLLKNKQTILRKPAKLPADEDVKMFRDYVISRMETLTSDPFNMFDLDSFVELRDCACARITLLNGRRGGKPARLYLSEYFEVLDDDYIDKSRLDEFDLTDQNLIQTIKITYMAGKGTKQVPVLIPPDNKYLFACTKNSDSHTSGWSAIHSIALKLDLKKPENFKATGNRHYISTIFSELDLPESDRELFYTHMGHSKDTNKNTYQTPQAMRTITHIGSRLLEIEGGNKVQELTLERTNNEASCSTSNIPEKSKKRKTENVMQQKSCNKLHKGDEPQNTIISDRDYHSWKPRDEELLLARFKIILEENIMPSQKDILEFLEESGIDVTYKTARTKLTNERVKFLKRKQLRLKELLNK